ncbi:hypothetical protein MRX96_018727 [Rhipicephalus microplus]
MFLHRSPQLRLPHSPSSIPSLPSLSPIANLSWSPPVFSPMPSPGWSFQFPSPSSPIAGPSRSFQFPAPSSPIAGPSRQAAVRNNGELKTLQMNVNGEPRTLKWLVF